MYEKHRTLTNVENALAALYTPSFVFNSGIVIPHSDALGTYAIRYSLVKEKRGVGSQQAREYESVLTNIRLSDSETIGIMSLSSGKHGYLSFYEPTSMKLLGVLHLDSGMPIEHQ